MVGLSILNSTYQCLERRPVRDEVAGSHLNHKPRGFKPKRALASHNVNAPIGTGWRDIHHIALRLQYFGNEVREVVSSKRACYAAFDLVTGDGLKFDFFLFWWR
jgi:hypothetical protein